MSRPHSPHAKALLGIGYLAVLSLLIATSIAAYRHDLPWQRTVDVWIRTSGAGLELNVNSDVKLQGLQVGVVSSIESDGEAARIVLALAPETVDLIPAGVDAAIVPKTLFGEKYVDLRVPVDATDRPITDGDEIRQSRTSIELGAVYDKLVPVLEALQPQKLSLVLTALANALHGRGDDLATTLKRVDRLSQALGPHLDTLVHDLDQFAVTADTYASAADNLIETLDASAGISRDLLVPREQSFADFLHSTILSVDTTEEFLDRNGPDVIRLTGESRAVLALLDEYSSSIGCFLKAMHVGDNLLNSTVGSRGPFTDLTVDMVSTNKPYTAPGDLPTNPRSDAHDSNLPSWAPSWRPHCIQYAPWVYRVGNAEVGELTRETPGREATTQGSAEPSATTDVAPTAIQEAREGLARAKAALALGVSQDAVPSFATLLILPVIADGEVLAR